MEFLPAQVKRPTCACARTPWDIFLRLVFVNARSLTGRDISEIAVVGDDFYHDIEASGRPREGQTVAPVSCHWKTEMREDVEPKLLA